MEFADQPWDYLGAGEAVDLEHPLVQAKAAELRTGDDIALARLAFVFVRDQITDDGGAGGRWRASDVLAEGGGSPSGRVHLLVALLRAGGVQAGLCYQRLRDGDGPDFVVHGLVAALIDDRWVRLDPRGDVEFSADEDRVAVQADPARGEQDGTTIYASPPPSPLEAIEPAG
ncbi:transglutaminase-like domain-containing protein [Actinomadura hibisca]|uniref:transglutaminase-like domain-containing protein n=1 Tax=Actinomadura hibisca TaxID=68565 RepID=UPI000829EBF5|nr:transglutaminase family protein [Actinomadura hibisca]